MPPLSFNAKRAIVAVTALVPLACVGNWYFEWKVFGRLDKKVMILSFVLWAVVMHFFGPTVKEIEDYRRENPNA